jgi:hypothetical protein
MTPARPPSAPTTSSTICLRPSRASSDVRSASAARRSDVSSRRRRSFSSAAANGSCSSAQRRHTASSASTPSRSCTSRAPRAPGSPGRGTATRSAVRAASSSGASPGGGAADGAGAGAAGVEPGGERGRLPGLQQQAITGRHQGPAVPAQAPDAQAGHRQPPAQPDGGPLGERGQVQVQAGFTPEFMEIRHGTAFGGESVKYNGFVHVVSRKILNIWRARCKRLPGSVVIKPVDAMCTMARGLRMWRTFNEQRSPRMWYRRGMNILAQHPHPGSGASCSLVTGLAAGSGRAGYCRRQGHAAERLLRPDPRTLRRVQPGLRRPLEAGDRQDADRRHVARRDRASRRAGSSTDCRPTW